MRPTVAALLLLSTLPLFGETFTVTSPGDEGFGSLRWAIEQANATPGLDRIVSGINGSTIVLGKALPFILDSAEIDLGNVTVDAHAVMDGLTITANEVSVAYVVIKGAKRAAFRVFGGDVTITDSQARDSAIGFQVLGDGNTIGAIFYPCYFDPCPRMPFGNVVANNGVGIYVVGDDNDILGNDVTHSEEHGIIVTGKANRLEENGSSYNAWSGVAVAAGNPVTRQNGVCNGHKLIETSGSDAIPHLTSVIADQSMITVEGTLHAQPLQAYEVRLVATAGACEAGTAASVTPLADWIETDAIPVTTDANGEATFRRARYAGSAEAVAAWSLRLDPLSVNRSVSDSSTPVPVERNEHPTADLAVSTTAARTAGAEITFSVTLTNHGPSTVSTLVDIPRPAGTAYVGYRMIGSEHPTTCWLSGLEFCSVTLLAGETQTIEHTVRITGAANPIVYRATIRPGYNVPDPDPSNNTAETNVALRVKPRSVRK